jgi:hypothetical protein
MKNTNIIIISLVILLILGTTVFFVTNSLNRQSPNVQESIKVANNLTSSLTNNISSFQSSLISSSLSKVSSTRQTQSDTSKPISKDGITDNPEEPKGSKEANDFYSKDNQRTYTDGRESTNRKLYFYDSYNINIEDKPFFSYVPAEVNKNDKLELKRVITEWNKYEAVKVEQGGGNITREDNVGQGNSDQSIKATRDISVKYFDKAKKLFQQELPNLQVVDQISDRSVDSVTIDFLTNKGFYTVQVPKSDLESGKSIWSELYKDSKQYLLDFQRLERENP